MLRDFDYLFYLDADEWLEEDAVNTLRAWKQSAPSLPLYTVKRRNWVDLPSRKFLFYTDRRARLVRREFALWTEKMIVHEALPSLPNESTGAFVEHTFATSIEDRSAKEDRYALLWAVRMAAEGRTPKPVSVERAAHQFKYSVLYGGMLRGGADGARLAAAVGRYHGRKHEFLRAIRAGAFPELAAAYASGEYEKVMKMADAEIAKAR
jgi:(heptosyl)LPS beta-1,4-glucosyltransferase